MGKERPPEGAKCNWEITDSELTTFHFIKGEWKFKNWIGRMKPVQSKASQELTKKYLEENNCKTNGP